MALTINTNISSLIAQRSLLESTNALNTSIERMTTGYKINHSKDSAAGYAIAELWETQLTSLDIAADNAAMGMDMLTTAEGTYDLLIGHIQRVRDLTEQAANGTYGASSKDAIEAEITARLSEVDRIALSSEFNGLKLMDGTITTDVKLQVGINKDANSQITLSSALFAKADVATLFAAAPVKTIATVAKACAGKDTATGHSASDLLAEIDKVITAISKRATDLGAAQNRVESAISAIDVQSQNLTSSLSTIRDTDVAEESSKYIQAQILQQASATLLSTANQLPSIALNLI